MGFGLRWAKGTMYYIGAQISLGKWQFWVHLLAQCKVSVRNIRHVVNILNLVDGAR